MSHTNEQILAIVRAEPWLLHRPAECVNVLCSEKFWCVGCDPLGEQPCGSNTWPCVVVREQSPMYHAAVDTVMIYLNKTLRQVAHDIRADMVCCDMYSQVQEAALRASTGDETRDAMWMPEDHMPNYHAICHYGEMAARTAESHLVRLVDDTQP